MLNRNDRTSRSSEQQALIESLRGLVAENGLIMRPGLSSDGPTSWPASAYGLPVLAAFDPAATRAIVGHSSDVQKSLSDQIADDPIWGRWYAVQVEMSTGHPIPGNWAEGILDRQELPADGAGQVAAIAAITDVVQEKALTLPRARAIDLGRQLRDAAAATDNPYSTCRALQSAAVLGDRTTSAVLRPLTDPDLRRPMSTEAIVDLYGLLCAERQLGREPDPAQLTQIRAWLEPHLRAPAAGAEFEAYYLTQSWLLAGGDRRHLQPLATGLRTRIDPDTGLLRGHTVRLGTLDNTYFAAVLSETYSAVGEVIGADTVRAVRGVIPDLRRRRSAPDLLMCAVVLRYAGHPDSTLEAEAVSLAEQALAGGINRENVVVAARTMTMLQQLGRHLPLVAGAVFPVNGAEDRYLAWTMLGVAPLLSNADEVRLRFRVQVGQVPSVLSNPDQLMVMEVAAAMSVPGSGVDRDRPPVPLARWATSIRGCDGYPMLFRPVMRESRCTLEATVQMLDSGIGIV